MNCSFKVIKSAMWRIVTRTLLFFAILSFAQITVSTEAFSATPTQNNGNGNTTSTTGNSSSLANLFQSIIPQLQQLTQQLVQQIRQILQRIGLTQNGGSCIGGATPLSHGTITAKPLGSTAAANGYYEYLPTGYNGVTKFPLLIFFHGRGENGNGSSNLNIVISYGPIQAVQAGNWNDFVRPFIILSPQHSSSVGGCPSADEIHAFINYAVATYAVDTDRIYTTGLSCGAIGEWNYFSTYTDRQVAAAVLLSGADKGLSGTDKGNTWSTQGCNLTNVPVWGIHGTADQTVSFTDDQGLFSNLINCPQPPRQDIAFTPLPGFGHDIPWASIYNNTWNYASFSTQGDAPANGDIYAWLLAHPKAGASPLLSSCKGSSTRRW